MSAGFVVDASVGFAWVYDGQASPETAKLLEEVASGRPVVVPSLWFLEVANVLLVAQRRQRITVTQRRAALGQLGGLQLVRDDEAGCNAFGKISDLAERHGLTVYDATYLELAARRKLPLASRDEPLRQAARRCGVAVL